MSLPPGFLDELRNRTSIAQVVGRKVIWDNRKSNQAKGDMWAPCPFHQEKTASFHVEDRKGFYYCFGCHAKGDAITFVKETENVSFIEAVEILAKEAGMQMPARDPRAQAKADRNTELAKTTEAAVAHFRLQLKTGAAADARAYLARRGLDEQTLNRFEIGFAPDSWQGLWDALKGKGVPDDHILDTGLAKPSQKGGKPYDTFRGRIMFPIRDPRGRCIGFGGRAMDPNDNAKYLNSPETVLFDKGRSLYNHGPAREAAGKGQPLIVAEGYMDVIALAQAGFTAAVAPLGTAITEDQLRLMWRITDEPIITLDGDKAGQRAAMRLIDLALPMLEEGRGLRFVIMPDGQDPDDLLKEKGADAFQTLLDKAEPMVNLLWRRETEGHVFDSPERRAGLDKRLRTALKAIKDPSLRRHYGDAIATFRQGLFGTGRPQRQAWRGRGFAEAQAPLAATRVKASALDGKRLRGALILATLIRYPDLIDAYEDDLERFAPSDPDHMALATALARTSARDPQALNEEFYALSLGPALESLWSSSHLAITPFLIGEGDPHRASQCLDEEFKLHAAQRAIEEESLEGLEDIHRVPDNGDERLHYRMTHAVRSKHAATQSKEEDGADQFGDTAEARSAFHELLSNAGRGKTPRK